MVTNQTPPTPAPTRPGDKKLMGSGGDIRGKVSMKDLFGRPNIKKDGTKGKVCAGLACWTRCRQQRMRQQEWP